MFSKTTHRLFALIIVVVIVAASGLSTAVQAQQAGNVVADLGFRPDGNGFGFPNYGADTPVTNLTPAEMRRLIGDAVCATINGDPCVLVPPMQQLMDTLNGKMGGGHCEGMAVLSTIFFAGKEKASDFGQDKATGLPFDSNVKLQREIAMWFATQFLNSVGDATIKDKTPKEVLDILTKALTDRSEYYVVHIFQPGYKNGHAITPYAVQDMGGGVFHVMVYDNNWPKDQNRFIEIDTNANKWTYLAATNPSVPEAVYNGDAASKSLQLAPINLRVSKQSCPACTAALDSMRVMYASGAAAQTGAYHIGRTAAVQAAPAVNEVSLYSTTGDVSATDLLITDAQGHRLGYQGGQFFSEIPTAEFIPAVSGDLFADDPEPVYYIPVGIAFTITLDGSALKADEITNVSMVGPTYDLAVENIKVKAGEKDTLVFSPDGSKLAYTPSSDESPDIIVGLQHDGPDYEFDIKGADIQPGATINVTLDYDKGQLGINTTGTGEKTSTYAIQVDRLTDTAQDTFSHDGLTLDPGQTAYIMFGAWDGKGDMNIGLDTNNDGTADSTQAEPNTHQ